MKISLNNYEAFFLDFLEGNLSDQEIAALQLFLSDKPELKNDLDEMEMITLPKGEVIKSDLIEKLKVDEESGVLNYDSLLISRIEKIETKEGKLTLDKLLFESDSMSLDLERYRKTIVTPPVILYPNKEKLLQKSRPIIVFKPVLKYAAAAVFLGAILWVGSLKETADYQPRLAGKNMSPPVEEKPTSQVAYTVFEDSIKNQAPINQTKKSIPKPIKIEQPIADQEKSNLADIGPLKNDIENQSPESRPVEIDKQINIESNKELIAEEMPKGKSDKKKDFTPINEFAKEAIRKEVLNNKTITETLAKELADLTKQKVSFEYNKKEEKANQFAINIGRFSISRK